MHFTCLTFLLLYSEKKCGKCRDELVWRGGLCKACDENAKKRKCFGCGDLHEKGAYSSKEWIKADLLCRACDENLEKKCFGCGDLQGKGAYHWEEWRKRAPRCIACFGEYLFSLDLILFLCNV